MTSSTPSSTGAEQGMPTRDEQREPRPIRQAVDVESPSGPEPMAGEPTSTKPETAPPPEVAELEDRLRRALADLDNLRKRYARELHRERAAERDHVAAALLPVV